MHFPTRILAIGAALLILGIAGGLIRATRPVDRHLKVTVHMMSLYAGPDTI